MSYTVLARRYRSDTFDEVVGQDAVSQTLKNAIETDRVAHAYLFTGTRGVGKTTMTRILAKSLNCLKYDKPTTTPCCKCESCLAISEGNDMDVIEIDGASHTGVEHIRELRQNAIYKPARSRYKIYIIDEVHMLSVSAFNALLKTLEEPPDHVKFIFATTEANKILPTILSRCQRFDFRNIQLDDICAQLQNILKGEKIKADDVVIRRIARHANGSMRDALSLLDQLLSMSDGKLTLDLFSELMGTPRSERIIALAETIGQGDLAGALEQIDTALTEGLALEQIAQTLQDHFRDLMVLRNCGKDTELVDVDEQAVRNQMAQQSKMFDDAALVYNITVLEELRRSIKSSGSGRALLEAALVRLTCCDRFSDTRVLLEQIQQLQQLQNSEIRNHPQTSSAPPAPKSTPPTQNPDNSPLLKSQATSEKPKAASKKKLLNLPDTLSLEYLQQHWRNILELLDQYQAVGKSRYLYPAQVISFRDGLITIGFSHKEDGLRQALTALPQAIAEIEKALSEIVSQPVKLDLTTSNNPHTANSAQPNGTGNTSVPSAPGAKPSQQEINNAANDPLVKQVQEILDGKVVQIKRITK